MLKFWLQQCFVPPTNYNDKVWVAVKFKVFGRVEVGSWGVKCLGSWIDFFMGSLEVNEGEKMTQPQCLQQIQ
jgi:hypothetical protein